MQMKIDLNTQVQLTYFLGLLRAQYVYQLPMIELAKGKIRDRNTKANLNADDCFFIATIAIGSNLFEIVERVNYAIGIEWAETALQ